MIPSRPRTWQRSPKVPSSRWPGARLSGLPRRAANAHKLVRQAHPNHRRLERPAPSRQTVGEITEDTKGQRRQRDLTEGARDSGVRKPSGALEEESSPSRHTPSSAPCSAGDAEQGIGTRRSHRRYSTPISPMPSRFQKGLRHPPPCNGRGHSAAKKGATRLRHHARCSPPQLFCLGQARGAHTQSDEARYELRRTRHSCCDRHAAA